MTHPLRGMRQGAGGEPVSTPHHALAAHLRITGNRLRTGPPQRAGPSPNSQEPSPR